MSILKNDRVALAVIGAAALGQPTSVEEAQVIPWSLESSQISRPTFIAPRECSINHQGLFTFPWKGPTTAFFIQVDPKALQAAEGKNSSLQLADLLPTPLIVALADAQLSENTIGLILYPKVDVGADWNAIDWNTLQNDLEKKLSPSSRTRLRLAISSQHLLLDSIGPRADSEAILFNAAGAPLTLDAASPWPYQSGTRYVDYSSANQPRLRVESIIKTNPFFETLSNSGSWLEAISILNEISLYSAKPAQIRARADRLRTNILEGRAYENASLDSLNETTDLTGTLNFERAGQLVRQSRGGAGRPQSSEVEAQVGVGSDADNFLSIFASNHELEHNLWIQVSPSQKIFGMDGAHGMLAQAMPIFIGLGPDDSVTVISSQFRSSHEPRPFGVYDVVAEIKAATTGQDGEPSFISTQESPTDSAQKLLLTLAQPSTVPTPLGSIVGSSFDLSWERARAEQIIDQLTSGPLSNLPGQAALREDAQHMKESLQGIDGKFTASLRPDGYLEIVFRNDSHDSVFVDVSIQYDETSSVRGEMEGVGIQVSPHSAPRVLYPLQPLRSQQGASLSNIRLKIGFDQSDAEGTFFMLSPAVNVSARAVIWPQDTIAEVSGHCVARAVHDQRSGGDPGFVPLTDSIESEDLLAASAALAGRAKPTYPQITAGSK